MSHIPRCSPGLRTNTLVPASSTPSSPLTLCPLVEEPPFISSSLSPSQMGVPQLPKHGNSHFVMPQTRIELQWRAFARRRLNRVSTCVVSREKCQYTIREEGNEVAVEVEEGGDLDEICQQTVDGFFFFFSSITLKRRISLFRQHHFFLFSLLLLEKPLLVKRARTTTCSSGNALRRTAKVEWHFITYIRSGMLMGDHSLHQFTSAHGDVALEMHLWTVGKPEHREQCGIRHAGAPIVYEFRHHSSFHGAAWW